MAFAFCEASLTHYQCVSPRYICDTAFSSGCR